MTDAQRIRVRFAPSPTGELHVGNARTALLNWLFARRWRGKFVLRIEDTDRIRTTDAFEESLLDDLRWLGIEWDEGPGIGGAYGPYHQSGRREIYSDCLRRLVAEERVYPCYCTEEELEAERADLISRRMMPRYQGRCRRLTAGDRRKFENQGRSPAWRFRVVDGPILFDDLIRGSMTFQGEAVGDFIIVRSNGIPAYNFAVVADDHSMEISHVIRGEDHLSNTATQVLLYRALGFAQPLFAHHSLILGKDHTKLSKRHGAVSVREFRRRGILPEALLNYLAILGGSFEAGREVCKARELIETFSLERTGKGGAVFDEEKLLWINGIHIRRLDPKVLTDILIPFIRAAGYDGSSFQRDRLEGIVATVRDNLRTLADVGGFLDLFDDDRYRIDEEAATLLRGEEAKTVLTALRKELVLLAAGGGEGSGLTGWIRNNETGLKGKKLYLPIRAAVTGRLHGPELDQIFRHLGPSSLLRRVERALALS